MLDAPHGICVALDAIWHRHPAAWRVLTGPKSPNLTHLLQCASKFTQHQAEPVFSGIKFGSTLTC